ncbi:MAG: PKD domain-containing protein [Bacteroidia bacterium]|nr:PKD domain-containing protein [Bacteroidia bacterium]
MKKTTSYIKALSIMVLLIFSLNGKSQCFPNFIYSAGPNGQVTFTSVTTNLTNSLTAQYFWSFPVFPFTYTAVGAAGISTSVTFTNNGVYTVTLTVNQSSSCVNVPIPITFTVSNACAIAPTATYTQGFNGLISFINNTTGTVSGTTYIWNFGTPSLPSNSFAPSYNYTANGAYVVTLTANNNVTPSCSGSNTLLVNVTSVCTLTAGINFSMLPSGNVSFSATTNASTLTSNTYTWNFGAPSASTNAQSTTVSYTANGIYTISLSVTNSSTGCVASAIQTIVVNNICPIAPSATYIQGSNGLINFINTTTGTVSGTTYTWNFGTPSLPSNSFAPSYNYTANGVYVVTLTANNNVTPTCSGSNTLAVNVTSVCTFTAGINFTLLPLGNVSFSAATNALPLSTNSYTWNFGVPSSSTNVQSALISYTANGIYTINLAVANNSANCVANAVQTINVNNVCAISASFTALQGMNGSYLFNNISTGTLGATTYTWNFGDGSPQSFLVSPAHSYTANGLYTVTLSAMNFSPSCFSTKTLQVQVTTNCSLTSNFTFSLGFNGLVTFSATSTVPNPTATIKHNWNIPPVGNFTIANPVVNYLANGIYTVTLNDTINSLSCFSSITKTLSITNIGACGLGASFTHTLGNSGFTNFTNHSTGTLSSTSYTWDFGDGFTSTSFNPIHTYINAGTHYASLIAVNSATCMDTTFLAINVTGLSCIANSGFSLTPTSTPQYWNALPSYPWNVVNASWSWGDNTSSNSLYTSHQYSTSGNYNICLTVTVSCGATSSTCSTYSVYKTANNVVNINVIKPAGIFEITGIENSITENRDYKIVPNPNNGWFMLTINTSAVEFKISVRNLLGQNIYEEVCVASNGMQEKQLDLRESPAGVYFVELSVGGKTHTKKIVISK